MMSFLLLNQQCQSTEGKEIIQNTKHTDTQTHTQANPQTGPIKIHCATKISAQCIN